MKVSLLFNFKHWMVGVSFDRYNMLLSIGPINIAFANYKKYEKDSMRAMEDHIIHNGGIEK
jgi:hypothetical protein